MKEATFTLAAGKEVPERLNGQVIRYTLPSAIADLVAVTGLNATISISGTDAEKAEQVIIGVFNEGFDLNHRQKIAKRLAAKDGSTVESITTGMLEHKPGIRTARGDGQPRATSQTRAVKNVANDLLAELEKTNPAMAQAYRDRLAAIAPKPKVAAEPTAPVETASPAETPAPEAKPTGKRK